MSIRRRDGVNVTSYKSVLKIAISITGTNQAHVCVVSRGSVSIRNDQVTLIQLILTRSYKVLVGSSLGLRHRLVRVSVNGIGADV